MAPAAPFALRGAVVTPDEVIGDGWVEIRALDGEPPRLADLRAALIARYPQVGPIFA